MAPDKNILIPLAEKIKELSKRPEEEKKKQLWADHQALKPTDKIPVSVYYEGIPGKQWEHMFGPDFLKCEDPLARSIESDLRRRIWMAENVPDDHVVWDTVIINVPVRQVQGWGVDISWKHSEEELGAKGYDPPFKDGIDVKKLTRPEYEWNEEEIRARLSKAAELTGGKLTVFPGYKQFNYAPFDIAVEMRGMENLLMDVVMDPDHLKELLEFITSSTEKYDSKRNELGLISIFSTEDSIQQYGFRVHCAYLADDFSARKPGLQDEWIYISAQTSAGLGPDQYAEFVQPYNERLAAPYTEQTVYYHGCECLDQKIDVIKDLPNMRRFHVSPWSKVERAVETFQGSMVLEVHDHPGKTFLLTEKEDMKKPIQDLVVRADGHPMDLNLSDIHSFNNNPALLTQWAECAQECAEK